MSAEQLSLHHDKHHAKYVATLNELVSGTEWENRPLEQIVREAKPGPLFNNAAQHWNHSFFWKCLSPKGGGDPSGTLADEIRRGFGDAGTFRKKFAEATAAIFGSGWAWLVREPSGKLSVQTTANADDTLPHGWTALLACDMWEHAYYVDYRNEKTKYVDAFWNLVNWEFVAAQL
jgi:Fe-Mn family superoxide dismutase